MREAGVAICAAVLGCVVYGHTKQDSDLIFRQRPNFAIPGEAVSVIDFWKRPFGESESGRRQRVQLAVLALEVL
jgi:hypothetical protein